MRRQIYELTLEDLDTCPIWEFASDEEEVEGQDEATVRPRHDLKEYDPSCSNIVKTQFISRSEAVYYGYCTPDTEGAITHMHPVIITPRGQVGFYFGALKPSPDELMADYERLGTSRENLFPIRFCSLVPAPGLVTSGTIRAFVRRTLDSPTLIEFT